MNEQLRVGDVLDTSFRVFRENLNLMFSLTALAAVVAALFQVPNSLPGLTGKLEMLSSPLYVIATIVSILAVVLLTAVVEGATTWAAFAGLRGQKATSIECYRKAFGLFWPLVGITLAVGALTGVGFILCLVPGFIAIATYAVAFPALMIEGRQAVSPINRSRQLTKGHRGKVLLTVLVAGIIVLIINIGLQAVVAAVFGLRAFSMFVPQIVPTPGYALLTIFSQFLSVLLMPLSTIPFVVLFMTLRDMKEGAELEHKVDQLVDAAASQDTRSKPASF